jgi:two-component system, NtrC family, sensor kinase
VTHSVLVLDDSLTVRMDLAEALEAAGFRVHPCGTAADARRRLSAEPIDVVILDVVLPDGDGIDFLRELRATAGRRVAVLMLSSEADVHDRIRGITTGADEYLGKPYEMSYVVAKVQELAGRRREASVNSGPLLVIDDSRTFREALRQALEANGHRVVAVETGEEGLRAAARERPRALIVDGVLPGIDGSSVIRRFRLDAALRGVPCVLLTGTRGIDAELRALDAGADAFLHKEQDFELILAKLQAVLRSEPATRSADEPTSLLAPKKILIVEGGAGHRELVADALSQDGYEVIAARSGEEAIELFAVQAVDCILLDAAMPGGALETCRRLKSSPGVRDTPVIMLASVEDRASALEGLASGADDFIQKSTELEVLKARVRAQLRRRQLEDETRRVRERIMQGELEASEARAARELAATREAAYRELQAAQARLIQSAKMASLGELVAGVAHEINNPLAFAQSHLATALKCLGEVEHKLGKPAFSAVAPVWEKAGDRLREMSLGLDRIRELVVKLRTFSRLDEGEQKLVSVAECVESVLTILAHRFGERVQVKTELGAPDLLDCYPALLNQALMNLVANAIDAIEGPGQITIRSGGEAGAYVICVADTGSGIPEALRERVLEPFFTTKPVGQGTGLGLSITHSIVQKHGGTLELAPGPTRGTVATIRIPLVRRPDL